ncbi:spore coat associated protein CotJA [Ruminococcus flavefaciens]|mgnify:CR=1 FL=1|uniref:spore coat associated protein CotJA n=1 Tax=Ruminococcus flavefaciens TaxID=1265 RepID=UPI0026F0487C|nr:spore coat associated protein CotJA [Ruminococcus flavefaciens]MDD7515450.1 spore coat associated protein CotJA [Ruminococcus flavefaciens]MDY5692698.1 spore coat associated protein CotJA [Ruminococcus flavefaciens]
MNLDLFDDMDGIILRERETSVNSMNIRPDTNGNSDTSRFPRNTPLAMAYVPFQQWGDVYDDDKALSKGTLFPELDLPFSGGGNSK